MEYGYPHIRKKWIRNAITLFSEINNSLKKRFKIHLENSFENDPEIFLEILKGIKSDNFRICLDIGHINVYSIQPIEYWIDKLAPYIEEVHLHNNDGKADHHWTLDVGNIDIENILHELENKVGKFVLTLEPRNREDLEKNLKWLEERGWL